MPLSCESISHGQSYPQPRDVDQDKTGHSRSFVAGIVCDLASEPGRFDKPGINKPWQVAVILQKLSANQLQSAFTPRLEVAYSRVWAGI